MKKISKATIAAINQLSPAELESRGALEKTKTGSICPFCGNGSGRDGTGITPIKNREGEDTLYHCFKCGKTFSNLQIFRNHYDVDNFAELVEKVCSDFDIALEYVDFDAPTGNRKKIKRRDETPVDEKTLAAIHEDLATPPDALIKFMDGVKLWRGLPLETLLKFNCRIIWQWTAPNSRHSTTYTPYLEPTDRIIIPCADDAYLARMPVGYKTANTQKARDFFKDKEKMHAGHKKLFNPDALTSTAPIFVVEGYVDCMSVDYVGYPCVALGAATAGNLLVDKIANMKDKPQFIILLDSDTTGRENAPKLLEELIGVNCPAVVRFLFDDVTKTDCNDILVENGVDALRGRLADILDDSVAELAAIAADFDERKATRNNDRDLNSLFKGNDSDLTFARRLETFFGSDVRWLYDDEQWLVYQNGVWRRGTEKNSCVAHFGRALADTLTQYATNSNEKNLAEKFQSTKKISSAITLLKTLDSIRITSEDLDKHPNLLNCLNGCVDLQTGWFYPNVEKRSAMITQQCRAGVYPDAKSELVDNFFRDIQPDETTRAGLLRWLGYCLTGECSEEKFLVWIGRGSNGKGVLGATLLELLGDYGTGLAQRALLRNSIFSNDADKATTSLNCLEHRRFALSEELPLKSELNVELVKNLTGGDRLPTRQLYREERTIRNYAKINISGNFRPTIENVNDLGLIRRLLNMPFTVQFGGSNGKPIDYDLKRKMLLPQNLNALLYLLIREAVAWYRRDDGGLIISDIMRQATERHLDENNFVADFIDNGDKFVRVANATVKAKFFIDELKAAYPDECAKFKKQDLIRYISNVGGVQYTIDNHNSRVFKGIGKLGDDVPPQANNDSIKSDNDKPTFDETDLPF